MDCRRCVFLVFYGLCYTYAQNPPPIANTPNGKVQGVIKSSYKGLPYIDFHGIPFAEPPVGKLRFEKPRPVKPWSNVLVANTSNACIQVEHNVEVPGGSSNGVEDCLQLNLFVTGAEVNPKNKFDVFVHFYGGGYMFGSKEDYAGPKFFMDRPGVILVVPNYRVGIFGFLSTKDKHLPGNAGMLDQVEVLRWVQRNIHSFGGNPKSVTLIGWSAGSSSVQYHYLSPLSKGLFHRGISTSNCVLNADALQKKPLEKARLVARVVGCPQEDNKQLVECLRSISAKKLNEAHHAFRPWVYNPVSPLGPISDPWSHTPFLPEHPYQLLKKGRVADLPWITTFSTSEGLYPAAEFYRFPQYLKDLDESWTELAQLLLMYTDTVDKENIAEVSDRIREEYFGDSHINLTTFNTLVKVISHRLYYPEIDTASRLQAKATKSDVWVYEFDYELEERKSCSFLFAGVTDKIGVSHGDDQMLIFSNPHVDTEEPMVDNDEKMKNFLLDIYITFARTGKPGIEGWVPVSKNYKEPFNYMHIGFDRTLKMKSEVGIGNRKFWQSLPIRENGNMFGRSTKAKHRS